MFGYHTPKDIVQLERVFNEGLAGSNVSHAQVFYKGGDSIYKTGHNEDFIFDILTAFPVQAPVQHEDDSISVKDEIEEFMRTVQALNFCFDIKIDIVFANGSNLIWYIKKMVKDAYKG